MKSFERLILTRLQKEVSAVTDPLQFAYRKSRGVDDAVLTLLHRVQMHLDKPGNVARLFFVDCSSAFNTVQPHLMGHRLQKLGVNPHLTLWVLFFLIERQQLVRLNGYCSSTKTILTGSPQGSAVSPVLFTLYTNDCKTNKPDLMYLKYSDSTTIVDTSNSLTGPCRLS